MILYNLRLHNDYMRTTDPVVVYCIQFYWGGYRIDEMISVHLTGR